jgi:probable HAF family extracellular repeat protein
VRWTGASFATIQSLGPFPGAVSTSSAALAVSADGSIIVGRATGADQNDHAFIWSAAAGMRDLKTVLVGDYGLDLSGWTLSEATGISNVVNGSFTVVGNGIDEQGQPEGFVAFLATPACSDGIDNDGDGRTDYPADTGCTSPVDWSETFDCQDGIDNDGDGLIDYPADPGCESPVDVGEQPQCSDHVDNDGDGRVDYPDQYPGCVSPDDPIERAQCSDGVDNDGDGLIDYPADTGCSSATAPSESPVALTAGNLVAVDRTSRAVFRVDVTTGAQTLISQAAHLEEPQGIAQRGAEVVVADPAGLVTVAGSGVQRLASPPLVANESLQVVFDAALNAYVLEASGISKVIWNPAGLGAKSTWLAVPTPEPIPVLSILKGDALAIEQSGSFLTAGLSLNGDGLFRVTPPTPTVAILRPGVENLTWRDIALEASGTILAVGDKGAHTGVYRVNPSTGASTALNESYAWQTPTGVAVAANGAIYVADAGTCASGSCSGGRIVRVDAMTGAVTPLASGGFIAGELDVVVLPEPEPWTIWLAGVAALAALHRRRSARRSR